MTLRELAEKKVKAVCRSGWQAGEYAHAEGYLEDREAGKVVGYRLCFCAAPLPGDHPDCGDDLWMEYTGPEVERLYLGPPLPSALFTREMPPELIALLGLLFSREEDPETEEVQEAIPDVPAYLIGPGMSA